MTALQQLAAGKPEAKGHLISQVRRFDGVRSLIQNLLI
jgi:hypothetical protein